MLIALKTSLQKKRPSIILPYFPFKQSHLYIIGLILIFYSIVFYSDFFGGLVYSPVVLYNFLLFGKFMLFFVSHLLRRCLLSLN